MKVNNAPQIKSEDFNKDSQATVELLGNILNPFMQEIVEVLNGRINFDNTEEVLRSITVELDSTGKIRQSKVNVGKSGIKGVTIINVVNQTNSKVYPTTAPFMSYTVLGNSFIQIDNITGLQPNNKYLVTFIVY